ncbi:MAG: virulence RhuM family protein [bacterium]|nr:virulence RhuM family protein [bacterium]
MEERVAPDLEFFLLCESGGQKISLHIGNIFAEGGLDESSVVKEYLTTAKDGKKYKTNHYNLDVTISVGYRVKSHRGENGDRPKNVNGDRPEAVYIRPVE